MKEFQSENKEKTTGKKQAFVNPWIKRIIVVIILLGLLIGGYIFVSKSFIFSGFGWGSDKPSLSASNIKTTLEKSSELITSKVNFKGIAKYSDGGLPVLNKGDFVMLYTATVKAGIDIEKVDCVIDNSQRIVYIYVPKAEIIDVKINPDSLEYYNESFVLFNNDEKEDTAKALTLAEESAEKDALDTGILDLANQQSQTLIKGILGSVVNNYEMKFFTTEDDLIKQKKSIEVPVSVTK